MSETDWDGDPILQGGGECGALIRAMDWHSHPLGPPADWPAELRTVVGIALGSSQPMLIVWGPGQTTLYNDGYAAMCGLRHPAAMGNPFRDLWFDIWDQVDPIITAAYEGIPTSMDDIQFLMHRKGYPEETHFAFSYTPVRNSRGQVLGMFCACSETTGEVLMRRRQLRERERFLQVFGNALGAVAILEGPQHVFVYANEDYLTLSGRRDLLGRTVAEALPEIVGQGYVALLDRVFSTGQPHVGKHVAVSLQRRPGMPAEERILDFLYQPIARADGSPDGIFVQAIDVTRQVEAERQQRLVNREIGHRLKNQLAVVQSIINQTLRNAPDLGAASASIAGRLAALSRAHDLLLTGNTGGATPRELVETLRQLHDPAGSRFTAGGPEITLSSRPALGLALILHELATNATKYGSLSTPEGRVAIRWGVEGDRFVLRWSESGGPPVGTPERTGTGTLLIRAALASAAENEVCLDYRPQGLEFRLSADLASLQKD